MMVAPSCAVTLIYRVFGPTFKLTGLCGAAKVLSEYSAAVALLAVTISAKAMDALLFATVIAAVLGLACVPVPAAVIA
jgi:hypothetical protein